ncbi:DUF371 domain-containing protein [Candidatus Woesearchaeota archaeon]|nr:MAG: DUF371 domain-containing protein [Candidatus Woesearchaeota archaeon]
MITFRAKGHQNILATHKTTLEITKEKSLTLKGNCIIAVGADFNPEELAKFAREHKRAVMILKTKDEIDRVKFDLNPTFSDREEIVIRLGEHESQRTLGTRADKAARHLNRRLIEYLKKGETLEVGLEAVE